MKAFEFNAFRGETSLDIQEMVSMEEKSLSSKTFDVPAGFKRTTIQDMMQMVHGKEEKRHDISSVLCERRLSNHRAPFIGKSSRTFGKLVL
jgi:hypothetical protein